MKRSTQSRSACACMIIALSILFSTWPAAPTIARTPTLTRAPAMQGSSATEIAPLSRRCGRVTPPGQPEPACCMSGMVFVDGSPIVGASVEIKNSRGDFVTMVTQVYSGTETRPLYEVSLSAAPLNVAVNDTITVTAKFSGRQKSLNYTVQPGSQQIDIVLPSTPDNNYVFERQIWGQAATGRLNQPTRVVADGKGSIYVIDGGNDRVQVFDRNGQFLRQWGTFGTLPGQFDFGGVVSGIAIDPTGNIYVADAGNHRIQKFSSNGTWLLTWGGFGQNNGQLYYPSGISIDNNGNVYVADSGNSRIQVFSSTGVWKGAWDAGYPSDVAVDSSGHVYVVNDMDVEQFSSGGTLLATWSTPLGADGFYYEPFGLSVDQNDNVYVVDAGNGQIHKFSNAGVWLASWGTYGTADGSMNRPRGVGVDVNGDIFVADTGNDRLQRFDGNGQWLATWGSVGSTLGRLTNPERISLDPNGNIYVIDQTSRVQKFSNSGVWLAFIGSTSNNPGQLSSPSSVGFDVSGNIYILDAGSNRIQKFSANGAYLATWGTFGSAPGQFNAPNDMSIDTSGNIYVADTGNNRIQKFSSSGSYLMEWGSMGSDLGQLSAPNNISVDANGNVYVLDAGNKRVQQFSANGGYLTAWNTLAGQPYQEASPNGIAVDTQGNVYVADAGLQNVQKFTSSGQLIATWGCSGTAIGCFQFGDMGDVASDLAVDVAGKVYVADRRNNRIQIFHSLTATKPVATITHVSSTSLNQTDTLIMNGMGQVSDTTATISDYTWTSDRDGVIGTGAILSRPASQLTAGTHHISLQVHNSQGQWSDPVTETIFVSAPPQTTWTMLLYLDGDYDDGGALLDDFTDRIDALESTLRNPYVRIAAQIDGPGDHDTRRVLITPGTSASLPQVVEDRNIAEQAMDTPEALTAFLRWGQGAFHADHFYLAIANHGQGIQGIGWDSTSDRLNDGMTNDNAYLTPRELGQALSAPGVDRINVLQLDACSMNLLEVAYEVRTNADYLIASQYLGWSYFAYNEYQHAIGEATSPADVAKSIVDTYANLASRNERPFTIAALDLDRIDPAARAVADLAAELRALVDNDPKNEAIINAIWSKSRKLDSNGDFQNNDLDTYLDLLDWSTNIQAGIDSPAVKTNAAALIAELSGSHPFVLRSRAQSNTLPPQYGGKYVDMTKSNGVSIFYPQLQNSVGFKNYVNDAIFSFTSDYQARWKRFLQGVSALAGPGDQLTPLPGPRAPLEGGKLIYVSLVQR